MSLISIRNLFYFNLFIYSFKSCVVNKAEGFNTPRLHRVMKELHTKCNYQPNKLMEVTTLLFVVVSNGQRCQDLVVCGLLLPDLQRCAA